MSIVSLLPRGRFRHHPLCPCPHCPCFLCHPCCHCLHCPRCVRPLVPPVCRNPLSSNSMPLICRRRSRCSLSSASGVAAATRGSLLYYGRLLRYTRKASVVSSSPHLPHPSAMLLCPSPPGGCRLIPQLVVVARRHQHRLQSVYMFLIVVSSHHRGCCIVVPAGDNC